MIPRYSIAYFCKAILRALLSVSYFPGLAILHSDRIALSLSDSTASPRVEYVGHFLYTSFQPVKAYVQQPALCDRIRNQLHDAASQGEGQYTTILVVWGLEGAGKSQLVLEYLRRNRHGYKATFWIQAGSREPIERDFIHIYQLLFGIRISAGQEMVQADDAVLAVKSWFSGDVIDGYSFSTALTQLKMRRTVIIST